jgi:hypothetical protein
VIYIAALAFAIAILMHLFGWSHGVVDVELFTLTGLLCLALSGCTWGWITVRRRAAPPA